MKHRLFAAITALSAACSDPGSVQLPDIYEYNVVLPQQYNQRPDTTWPTIFFLHGAGGVENHEDRFREYAANDPSFPFIVVVVNWGGGPIWVNRILRTTLDDVLDTYRIDPDRLYATGLSAGAFAVWNLAATRLGEFAAIVLAAGGGTNIFACDLADVPVWLVHNRNDNVVPVTESIRLYNAITDCGGTLARLTLNDSEPPGAHPHDAWSALYSSSAFYDWLLRHRRDQPGPIE